MAIAIEGIWTIDHDDSNSANLNYVAWNLQNFNYVIWILENIIL